MIQQIELVSLITFPFKRKKKQKTRLNSLNIDVVITTNVTASDDEYPTIEADDNALEAPSQKDVSTKISAVNTPKQFGCASYCQNRGVCVLAAQSVSCRCPTGYTGLRCQVARKIKKEKTT
jgi:hypothetical protein